MKGIRKCSPLMKIFLFVVFTSILLAMIHILTEKPIKEALKNATNWSATKDDQSLTFTYKGKPVVTIDKDTGLNQYAKLSDLEANAGDFVKRSELNNLPQKPTRITKSTCLAAAIAQYTGKLGSTNAAKNALVGTTLKVRESTGKTDPPYGCSVKVGGCGNTASPCGNAYWNTKHGGDYRSPHPPYHAYYIRVGGLHHPTAPPPAPPTAPTPAPPPAPPTASRWRTRQSWGAGRSEPAMNVPQSRDINRYV